MYYIVITSIIVCIYWLFMKVKANNNRSRSWLTKVIDWFIFKLRAVEHIEHGSILKSVIKMSLFCKSQRLKKISVDWWT